jgi:hypothetical protein
MKLKAVFALAITVATLGAGTALAAMSNNTIDSAGTLAKQGRQATVTVLLECDRVQTVRLHVTLSQESTVAERCLAVRCGTDLGRFPVAAQARDRDRFEEGPATACAVAEAQDDARQWCKDVTLVGG